MSYAQRTSVSIERTREEIERMLMRRGAQSVGFMTESTRGLVQFRWNNLCVQLAVPFPDRANKRFTQTPSRKTARHADDAYLLWEQECKRRWRSLCAVVKALLVAVDDGILTVEQAFLAHLLWADGRTIGDHLLPEVRRVMAEGGALSGQRLLEATP